MRAVYFLNRPVEVDPTRAARRAVKYLARQENIDPAIREHALAFIKYYQDAWGHLPKPTDHPPILSIPGTSDLVGEAGWDAVQVYEAWMQALIYGHHKNFYDATEAFSLGHEYAHRMVRRLPIGEVLERLAREPHMMLAGLASVELSPQDIAWAWERLEKASELIDDRVKIFEPIEEIFATYFGLRFSPMSVRNKVIPLVAKELRERHWNKAYDAFATTCDNSFSPYVEAVLICQPTCAMLDQIGMDGAELLRCLAHIRRVISSRMVMILERIAQEDVNALDNFFDLEAKAAKEASEKINRLLDDAHIPRDIYWSVSEEARDVLKNQSMLTLEAIHNKQPLGECAPEVTMTGMLGQGFVMFCIGSFEHVKTAQNNLSPYARIFGESLRQQLLKGCGWVCPFDFYGEHCCGWKEAFKKLYARLPDKYRKHMTLPACARVS